MPSGPTAPRRNAPRAPFEILAPTSQAQTSMRRRWWLGSIFPQILTVRAVDARERRLERGRWDVKGAGIRRDDADPGSKARRMSRRTRPTPLIADD
jgi:hypothetical protein